MVTRSTFTSSHAKSGSANQAVADTSENSAARQAPTTAARTETNSCMHEPVPDEQQPIQTQSSFVISHQVDHRSLEDMVQQRMQQTHQHITHIHSHTICKRNSTTLSFHILCDLVYTL